MSLRVLSLLALAGCGLTGCANLAPAVNNKPILPTPQMSRDTIVLEMTTVEIPLGELGPGGELWREVDELLLDVELRRRLADAGIRTGVCGNELPPVVQAALAKLSDEPQVAAEDGQLVSITDPHRRRLQCRSGQRQQLILSDAARDMSVLWHDQGRVRGTTYRDAQGMFLLRAFPLQSGQARIVLTPQILHGQPESRWVGRDGMFLMETGKASERFENLTVELKLAPGEFLLTSCTSQPHGLGECLFVVDGAPKQQKIVILRLAQTQLDDLQPPVASDGPLVTGGR